MQVLESVEYVCRVVGAGPRHSLFRVVGVLHILYYSERLVLVLESVANDTYTHIHIHIHLYAHTQSFIHIHIHLYTHTHTRVYTYTYTCTHIHIHMYTHTHTHVHTYTHTCIHIHIHLYTHTHTWHNHVHTQASTAHLWALLCPTTTSPSRPPPRISNAQISSRNSI